MNVNYANGKVFVFLDEWEFHDLPKKSLVGEVIDETGPFKKKPTPKIKKPFCLSLSDSVSKPQVLIDGRSFEDATQVSVDIGRDFYDSLSFRKNPVLRIQEQGEVYMRVGDVPGCL